VILTEEGSKLLTTKWRDAEGVAWVALNRYRGWYQDGQIHGDVPINNRWFKALTTGIYGMHSYRLSLAAIAFDDIGDNNRLYTYFGSTREEAIIAYNVALLIVERAYYADPIDDPTGGAMRYADAYTIPNVGVFPWERTHFTTAQGEIDGVWWTMP
jgi:hypothetical protein